MLLYSFTGFSFVFVKFIDCNDNFQLTHFRNGYSRASIRTTAAINIDWFIKGKKASEAAAKPS
jgi:hypothetical protein